MIYSDDDLKKMSKEDLSDIKTERKIIKNIFGDLLSPIRRSI